MLDSRSDAAVDTHLRGAGRVALSSQWRLIQDGDTIRCVGGPDEFYVLTELASSTLTEVTSWIEVGSAPVDASGEAAEVLDFLRTIGAVAVDPAQTGSLSWLSVGPDAASTRLAAAVETIAPILTEDLLVVVRTGGSLAELAEHASHIGDQKHVLVDLTGHHTVSLGPLVTPRFTSCIGCYATRIANAWGDEASAAEPATQRWIATTAELLAIQLELIGGTGSPLLNATISWDLQQGAATHAKLLRTQQCRLCSNARTGSVPLPWNAA